MTWKVLGSLAIVYGVALAQSAPRAVLGGPPAVLTNQRVVLLAQAGYSEGSIIEIIKNKQSKFDVSPEGLTWLAQQGLTERIVGAMVVAERKQEMAPPLPFGILLPMPQTSPAEDNLPQSRAGARVTPSPPASSLSP